MLFNSYAFIFGFLPVTLSVFFLLGRSGRRRPALAWLFAASVFFYAWWSPRDLPFLLLSIALNYAIAAALVRTIDPRRRQELVTAGIAANLLVLAWCKYAGFVVMNVNAVLDTAWTVPRRTLPLAISFFTFQQIVFLVDASRRRRTRTGPLRYAAAVAFFPHLLAGPIVRYSQLMPQFGRRRILRPQPTMMAAGITVFTMGLVKKVILGDSLAQYVAVPFGAAAGGYRLSLVEAWAAALSYTFHIYFDFSGYSDMAIGLALLVGIVLPVNFNSPYKADSIIEFWRRWHMTLSAFLRDYLYIPLGGSRAGAPRRYANLMITMLLGGLWHGAAWTFVAWGGLHGVYLLVNHAWRGLRRPSSPPTRAARYASRLLTFTCVVVGWVFFRAESMETARVMIRSMAGFDGVSLPRSWMGPLAARLGTALPAWIGAGGMGTLGGWLQFAWLAAAVGIVWGLPNTQQVMARWPWLQDADSRAALAAARAGLLWEPSTSWAAVTAVLAFLGLLGLTRASAFIYFNF